MKKFLEKIVTGIITCSGFLTSVIILLIVVFLFSEGFGLFSQKTIEDGYTLVVNKDNPVNELNAKEIKEIFDEDITNWKEVGGKDEKIMLFRFDDMQKYFTAEELGKNYANADKCIERIVADNSGIIAFVPSGFIKDGFTGKKLEDHHIIHHAGPVPHHLAEIGAEVVGPPENRIVARREESPLQIVHFLQKHNCCFPIPMGLTRLRRRCERSGEEPSFSPLHLLHLFRYPFLSGHREDS